MDVREKYDRIAPYFDFLSGFMERSTISRAMDLLELRKKDRFLDLACGTGKVLRSAKKKTRLLYGCDFSKNMIAVAKRRAPFAAYLVCDVTKRLPYADASFDAINFSVTLGMIPQKKHWTLFREIRRVLKPRGRLVITEYTTRKKSPLAWFLALQHRVIPQFQDCGPLDVRRIVKKHGFGVVHDEIRTAWGFPFEIVLCKKRTFY